MLTVTLNECKLRSYHFTYAEQPAARGKVGQKIFNWERTHYYYPWLKDVFTSFSCAVYFKTAKDPYGTKEVGDLE